MKRRNARMLVVSVAIAVATSGCLTVKEPLTDRSPQERRIGPEPPRVDVPGRVAPPRRPLKTHYEALPEGAHAVLPAYDGDNVFVSLPVRRREEVSSREVLNEVVVPVLHAMGFERGANALQRPPDAGIPQPAGNFGGLAQAVVQEYAANPAMLRPRTKQMLDVFAGKAEPGRNLDKALEMGEGMSFAQFVAGLERLEIEYPFLQVDAGVPIEHTLLVASRWQGQGITSVWGSLIGQYTIANRRTVAAKDAARLAAKGLSKLPNVNCSMRRALEGPFLVLLPYRADASGATELRYAYRLLMSIDWFEQSGPVLLWLDAEDGRILKLNSFLDAAVGASGAAYNRDPGVGTTTTFFQVENAAGSLYTLQLAGFSNRPDYQGDGAAGFNALDVSISSSTNGSSATFANFNQTPLNDAAQALCASGTNKGYQQASFFGVLSRQYRLVSAQGIFTPFPTSAFNPLIESTSAGCNAYAGLNFGACAGYYSPSCPNASDGTTSSGNWLNTAHDNTWIAHELGHSITPRLTNGRPSDWCGSSPCTIPVGWGNFHDLCDAWSAHFENTNCWSGWFAKNSNGVDGALNCLTHDEGGWAPRLHQVTTPFNPGAPGDHFPEHRAIATGGYADMQIAAAALWEVRVGMRSKCRPSGMPQYGVRFQRALKQTGFLGFTPSTSDLGSFQHLYDLELKMADQWITSGSPGGAPAFAHNGPHTTNKVTGGFARDGVFLVPYTCLDGNAATTDAAACPAADIGADAVIDIDDNDATDDLTLNGASLPEVDYLRAGGPAPTFHVWTGPRYRLDGAGGAASFANPSPCNAKYRVEVSNDPAFPASTIMSPWRNVDQNPNSAATPECYDTWSPNNPDWTALQAGGSRIYYRVRTRDPADANERLSTQPAAGLWGTIAPPYAVITADGRPDY